jgi:hypothetical protein
MQQLDSFILISSVPLEESQRTNETILKIMGVKMKHG